MKFKEIFKRSHFFDHSWRYPDIEFIHIISQNILERKHFLQYVSYIFSSKYDFFVTLRGGSLSFDSIINSYVCMTKGGALYLVFPVIVIVVLAIFNF